MITARETPVEELPRAIAEAEGWIKAYYPCTLLAPQLDVWVDKATGIDVYTVKEFNPVHNHNQFHELTGDPETHAKICDVLDEWLTVELMTLQGSVVWWQNPTYLTENGGWRAWWLRAYLEILRDGK